MTISVLLEINRCQHTTIKSVTSIQYCFSHYVAALVLLVTRFKLLFNDWRGYSIAFFALVWVANQYTSLYSRLRLDIKKERLDIEAKQVEVEEMQESK